MNFVKVNQLLCTAAQYTKIDHAAYHSVLQTQEVKHPILSSFQVTIIHHKLISLPRSLVPSFTSVNPPHAPYLPFSLFQVPGCCSLLLLSLLQCNSSHQALLCHKSLVTSAVSHRQKVVTRARLFIRRQMGLFKTIAENRKKETLMMVGFKVLGMQQSKKFRRQRNVALKMKGNKAQRTKQIGGTNLKTMNMRTAIRQGKQGCDHSLQRIGLHEREKQYPDLSLLLSHFNFQ